MKFQDWIKTLPAGDIELISTNPAPFAPFVPGIPIGTAPRALAAAIGRIAWKRFIAGETTDPADVDANYVRRSDAELLWKGGRRFIGVAQARGAVTIGVPGTSSE